MTNSPDQLDLIWGGEEIAKAIGRTRRITFHLLEKGELPAKKVGGRWVAERGKLLRFFVETAA
ncbi:DNA-binding protein [Sinorhizobium meliloti]|uniref:DNA-binding protein n=1 Tax=Rhizobium meliloti TaxID=382 RepID=UPI00398CD1BD